MVRRTPYVACAASLAIGLFFVAVWAPHPWGWEGFDQYHDLGLVLARGEAFPTTDVPWGYAYFLAPFYGTFGDRPWIPLVAQVILNAAMPLLVFHLARDRFGERIAAAAALLTGLLSFNTVYASTQSSDAVCNVLFMCGVLIFDRAERSGGWLPYAAAGALFGIAMQFRPNLLLVPVLLAGFSVWRHRRWAAGPAALLLSAALMLSPWVARNYRLTGALIPTSTHAGMQLWYGTLQTGSYLKSRAHNPRSVFEYGSLPYTSLDTVPLVVTGRVRGCDPAREIRIVYWTDRDAVRRSVAVSRLPNDAFEARLPASPAPTAYYYAFDGVDRREQATPRVFFVSAEHLADVDRHGDVLDVFDVVRLLRFLAWHEPPSAASRLDLNHSGSLDGDDVERAVSILVPAGARGRVPAHIASTPEAVRLELASGSAIAVPHVWSGRITDLTVEGPAATALLRSSVPFTRIDSTIDESEPAGCAVDNAAVNAVFYREQPHMQRRYVALAFDNIGRDPAAYLASVLYRAVRVFFIEGSDDPHTTQQFSGGSRVYRLAFAASIGLFALFLAGVWAAIRRGSDVALPLVLIVYVPATLAFVLTNMRYSITVQPLMFIFAASALATLAEAAGWPARDRAETETARRP